jgi:uncharacterized caspase-like protein
VQAEKRVALLIGNNAYQNIPTLKAAVNDARSLAGVPRKLNFLVFVAENQSRGSVSEAGYGGAVEKIENDAQQRLTGGEQERTRGRFRLRLKA